MLIVFLVLWNAAFFANNAYWYFGNTYVMITLLGWKFIPAMLMPSVDFWFLIVPSVFVIPLFQIMMAVKAPFTTIEESERGSTWLWVLLASPTVTAICGFFGTALFPLKFDETGTYLRMFPFF